MHNSPVIEAIPTSTQNRRRKFFFTVTSVVITGLRKLRGPTTQARHHAPLSAPAPARLGPNTAPSAPLIPAPLPEGEAFRLTAASASFPPSAALRRRPSCAGPCLRRWVCGGGSRGGWRRGRNGARLRRRRRPRSMSDWRASGSSPTASATACRRLISSRRRAASSNSRLPAASFMRFSSSAIVACRLWPTAAERRRGRDRR